ncbi:outer membrane protein [Hylemonella sp. W303a]|uniref:outer membrane protein n=1 Tax=Hylemonella sp. W303a TaxID=3389873 RepID=UPI00396B2843
MKMSRAISTLLFACGAFVLSASAHAEFEFRFYTGIQGASDSQVKGDDPDGVGKFNFNAGWRGDSLSRKPPYYGLSLTWWREDDWGLSLDFTHAKVYADDKTLRKSGFEVLEFSDGLNLLMLNALRRFPDVMPGYAPYVGAGAGLAIPHVEVQTRDGSRETFEYQLAGPAVQLIGGVSYAMSTKWSAFTDFRVSYSQNSTRLDGGGELKTNIVTQALNVGVGYRF